MPASRRRRRRSSVALGALGLALALVTGACGGAGDGPPPPAPGANVDPNATGVVGGSINRAKNVAEDAETRDAQLDPGTTTAP